jgi:ribosomal protein S18 acetylase RimI-like enzyme
VADAVTTESLEGLHRLHGGPFVRTRLTADTVGAVWRLGSSVVVEQSRDRHGKPVSAPVLMCLGEAAEMARLLSLVARRLPERPGFVTVEARAFTALPDGWEHEYANRWGWMWTDRQPPAVPGEDTVEVVEDADEVHALLDEANPDSHGRPGDPGIRAWLGVRDRGRLVAAGALAESPHSGVAHIRGVSTLPAYRGGGLGTAVSARLTRRGLDTMSPLVTLGVYTANAAAITVYERLGFRHDRSFVSGPLRDASHAP